MKRFNTFGPPATVGGLSFIGVDFFSGYAIMATYLKNLNIYERVFWPPLCGLRVYPE